MALSARQFQSIPLPPLRISDVTLPPALPPCTNPALRFTDSMKLFRYKPSKIVLFPAQILMKRRSVSFTQNRWFFLFKKKTRKNEFYKKSEKFRFFAAFSQTLSHAFETDSVLQVHPRLTHSYYLKHTRDKRYCRYIVYRYPPRIKLHLRFTTVTFKSESDQCGTNPRFSCLSSV